MRPPLSYVPALPVAVGFVVGIIAAEWGIGWICAIAGVACFVALYFMGRHWCAFVSVAAVAGALLAIANAPVAFADGLMWKSGRCEAIVLEVAVAGHGQRMVARIDSIEGMARCRGFKAVIFNRQVTPGLCSGMKVNFSAKLEPVEEVKGLPYAPEYAKYQRYEGISATGVIYDESLVIEEAPGIWHRIVDGTREAMSDGIGRSGISRQAAEFLYATVLGEDGYLDPGITTGFRTAGLSHILALSGLHVGIIASFLVIILFPLRLLPSGRKMQMALAALLIWCYAIITGLSPSVTRAAVMLSVMIVARMAERNNSSFNSLFVAVIVVLAINPYSLFTPGFQMSFAAVAAILLVSRIIPKKMYSKPMQAFTLGLVIVPVAAMLGTGIVCAYYFHSLPMLFLPANIAMGILFPPFLALGIVLMCLSIVGVHAAWLAVAVDFLYKAITDVTHAFAGASSWQGIFFSAWAILPYWIAIALICECAKRRLGSAGEYDRKVRAFGIWGIAFLLASGCVGLALHERVPSGEVYLPDANPPALVLSAEDGAYILPLGRGYEPGEVCDIYNARYSAYLMSRGHDGFKALPDSTRFGFFYRRGEYLLVGDKLLVLADDSLAPAYPVTKPYRILIGGGFGGKIDDVARRGDTVIICKGVNGNRAAALRRQCGDSIFVDDSRPFTLVFK